MTALVAAWISLTGFQVLGDDLVQECAYGFSLPPGEGHGRRDFRVTVKGKELARTPTWAEDAEDPPLSARKAIRLATAKKSEYVKDTEALRWTFRDATLVPAGGGKWFWLVTFEGHSGGFETGIPWSVRIAVLMNGTVPEPTLDEEQPPD